MKLNITIHQDAAAFDRLSQEWLTLLSHSEVNEIFMTPAYQATWWNTLKSGELLLYEFRLETGQLIGIAPLFRSDGQIAFVGCKDVSDYLDFIIHKDHLDSVYQAIAIELKKLGPIKFSLCGLQQNSPSLKFLPLLLNLKTDQALSQQAVCPQIKLPTSWEAYLQNLERKQRHEIRRKWKKIKQVENVSFECLTGPQQISESVPHFIELHQLSSESKREFWDAHHQRFFEQLLPLLAAKNQLKLFFLSVDSHPKPIAAMLVFDYGNHYDLYNSGFNPKFGYLSPGQVLTSYSIKHAIEQGRELYDFLRGDESYKLRLGGQPQPIFDLEFEF